MSEALQRDPVTGQPTVITYENPSPYEFDVVDMRHGFLANSLVWFYALNGNAVFASLSAKHSGEGCWWLNDLFVVEESRRERLGTAIVEYAMEHFAELHRVVAFTCGVNVNNHASLGLFRKLGFQTVHAYECDTGTVLMLAKTVNQTQYDG